MLDVFLWTPVLSRALVVGAFGSVGLVLIVIYSRRGPLIYPVYAAIITALALLIARYPDVTFATRFVAALAGFVSASAPWYVLVNILANRQRDRLRREGRLAAGGHVPLFGHLWRVGALLLIGGVVSASVAFVAA